MRLLSPFCAALALAASACAPMREDGAAAESLLVPEANCGLPLVVASRSGRAGLTRIRSGDDLRACALPLAGDIAFACESKDTVFGPGDQSSRPNYRITDEQCTFTNREQSRAHFRFSLSATDAPPVVIEMALRYQFLDLSDDVVHDDFATLWRAEASCRPG